MELRFECQYCGDKWVNIILSKDQIEGMSCNKCGDSNLVVKQLKDCILDGYIGCPDFPETDSNDDDINKDDVLDDYEDYDDA